IYFAIYTLIAGVFAVLTRVAYRVFRSQPAEEAAERLSHVMGTLLDLVASTRNVTLEGYEGHDRVVLAATHVLENPDASETALEQAARDLTSNAHLAERLRAVEIYRRVGLWSRALDINREVATELEDELSKVRKSSPRLARTLKRRFVGLGPTKREGRPRTEGFIERVLAAGEEDNYELMTLADVEDVFTLAFELLAERSFTILSLDYHGIPRFGAAFVRVERLRREYRHLVRTRNNRLRALAEQLNRSDHIDRVASAIPVIGDVEEVLNNVLSAVDAYFSSLQKRNRRMPRFLKPKRAGTGSPSAATREKPFAQSVLKLYSSLYRANADLKKKHAELVKAIRDYQKIRSSTPESHLRLLSPAQSGQGIRLKRRTVSVPEDRRIGLAGELHRLLADVSVTPRFFRAVMDAEGTERRYISPVGYKHLAVSILLALDRAAGLSRPEVQYAIEGVHAPNVGIADRTLGREGTLGWALSVVQELVPNLQTAVQRVISALVSYHGARPTDELMEYLENEFGVPRSISEFMSPSERDRLGNLREELDRHLLSVPPPPKEYGSVIEKL
ncbi:MAG: hypothetical protein ACQETQ_11605, partial [Spirochaetota bacterium]